MSSSTCPPPIRSRQYLSGPQINFLPVVGSGPSQSQFDLRFQLAVPCNVFFIVSDAVQLSSKFLSLLPTNKTNAAGAIVINGTEQWFALNALQSGGPNYWTVLKFKEKTNLIYLSIGGEVASTNRFMLACMQDDELFVSGGMYT